MVRAMRAQGVDKIIICPIIVPSTSRRGFFYLTMQLHFCAFNIMYVPSMSCVTNPTYPLNIHVRIHRNKTLTEMKGGSSPPKPKKGVLGIILPAYDVLSFV